MLIEYAQATVLNEVADESYRALAEYYGDDEIAVITLLALWLWIIQ